MEITLEIEDEGENKVKLVMSHEDLDTLAIVGLHLDGQTYYIDVEELYYAVGVFMDFKINDCAEPE